MVQFELDINWPRTIWIVFGLVLAGAVVFVLHSFVGTFVFGIFLYYATRGSTAGFVVGSARRAWRPASRSPLPRCRRSSCSTTPRLSP